MKRFTLFVVALCAIGSTSTQAQGTRVSIGEVLNLVADCAGFDGVIYEQGARIQSQRLEVPAKVEKCDTTTGALESIRTFLPGSYRAELDAKNVLHISLAQAATPTNNNRPKIQAPQFSYSAAVLPDNYNGGPTWMDYSMQRQHEWEARNAAYLAYRYSAPVNIYMEPNVVGYPGHSGGYLGLPWRGCQSGPSGYIKFKYLGKPDERHLWYISLNGEVVGTIDQGDSFFNHVNVCATPTTVTIEKLGAGTWERNYSIRPRELTEIGVGDFLPLK